MNTAQIAAAGRSLVQSRLRLQGIATDEAAPRSGYHLVIRSPAHLAGTTIRVQANAQPKPGGGTGRSALDWMIPDRYRGDMVAVADLSSSRVWIFPTAEAFARAQQHPKDRHHLIMITDPAGFRGSKHSQILVEDFSDGLLEIRVASMLATRGYKT
jgi:hypothetical protein